MSLSTSSLIATKSTSSSSSLMLTTSSMSMARTTTTTTTTSGTSVSLGKPYHSYSYQQMYQSLSSKYCKCNKFLPQLFNANKCQQCFNLKEAHSAEALAEFCKVVRLFSFVLFDSWCFLRAFCFIFLQLSIK